MKKLLFTLLAAVSIFSLQACGDDDSPNSGAIADGFKCTVTELSFPMDGGDGVITAISPVKPEVTIADSWASVTDIQVHGSQKNIYKITVKAQPNTDGNDRTTTATLKAGSESAQVTLKQSAKPMLEADKASIEEAQKPFPKEGGEGSVKILSNTAFKAETSASWITIASTKALEQHTLSFTVAENTTMATRSGSIVITPADGSGLSPLTLTITQNGTEPQALLGMTATQIAADMFAGINIGNTLEVPGGETGWGNPKVNLDYIKGLKAAGFNAVRVPCAWDSYIINQADYTIDPAWLDRVYEVVGWITGNDMYAIVNIHWDGGWLEENVNEESRDKVLPKQRALWAQIARHLGGYNERLLFAGTNEPYQGKQGELGEKEMAVLLDYEQAFVDAVRAAGGNNPYRTLVFQGPATNIDKTVELMKTLPTDNTEGRLMAEIHYYDPWNFCGMDKDESWGKMAYFWGEPYYKEGSDRNSTWGDENYMKVQFDKMKTKFVEKGIPVIIGEYGAIVRHASLSADDAALNLASRAYFNKCVSQFGKERGLIPFLWDTGEVFDRTNGSVKAPELVDAIISGSSASYPF